eukprot:scaffold273_cov349-Prasinococcus_capsulatus_cf.AAC.10
MRRPAVEVRSSLTTPLWPPHACNIPLPKRVGPEWSPSRSAFARNGKIHGQHRSVAASHPLIGRAVACAASTLPALAAQGGGLRAVEYLLLPRTPELGKPGPWRGGFNTPGASSP